MVQSSKVFAYGLATVSIGALSLGLVMSYWAGCTGDVKTGVLGDPLRALELGRWALVSLLVGVAAGAVALAPRPGWSIGHIGAFVLLGIPLLWLVAIRVETWGVQSCF